MEKTGGEETCVTPFADLAALVLIPATAKESLIQAHFTLGEAKTHKTSCAISQFYVVCVLSISRKFFV